MKKRIRDYLPYALLLIAYFFVGAIAAHPFDDAIYAQNAQFFYLFRFPPILSLPMGIYYDFINVGGYFFTILLSLFHIQNVVTIQLGVKIPFIIFAFLTAFVLFEIGRELNFNSRAASLILLTSPIYFFTALVYGSAITVSVFFLVASLLFVIRRKITLSAIFYGMAIGSYLYPVFAIPFLVRYFWIKEGRNSAGKFLVVSTIFAAIGQLVTYLIYALEGIQGKAPISPTTFFAPLTYVQPYSPLDFLNVVKLGAFVPGETINILYYTSAIVASFVYFLIPKERVNFGSLLIFLFVQGILFSSLAPGNLPSYMAAEIPLAIIVSFIERRWIFIGLTWLSSFFSFWVMQTINHVGFIIYFSDVNQKILNVRNSYPSWVVNAAGSLYAISILANLFFLKGKGVDRKFAGGKTVAVQSSVVAVIVVVSLLILLPVVNDVPGSMYLSPQINTFQADISSVSIHDGNMYVSYSMPLELRYLSQREYVSGVILYQESQITVLDVMEKGMTDGNRSYEIKIPYPLVNAAITLFSPYAGNISIALESSGENIFPNGSSVQSGIPYKYNFIFHSIPTGNYTLSVFSNVPYYSSQSIPSIVIVGSLAQTKMIVDGTVTGGVIPFYLISSVVTVVFEGPFMEAPPILPTLYFYVNTSGASPSITYMALGAFIFILLIAFVILFLRRV
ncbi:MAG: hypothetical protein QW292_12670 [Candidatus Parvarchaeota archaeon]